MKEVENSKASGAKKKSKYTVGIGTQVHAMVTRYSLFHSPLPPPPFF